jgi:hypothetical protein
VRDLFAIVDERLQVSEIKQQEIQKIENAEWVKNIKGRDM